MLRLLVAISLLLVAGCNDLQPTAPQKTPQIRTIAIVTAFNDRIETKYVGRAPADNSTVKTKVEWPIDAHVQMTATALLKDRYTIKDIPYSPAAVYAEADFGNRLMGGAPDAGQRVRKVIPPGAVDAIVFIAPRLYGSGNGLYSSDLEGVGYFTRNSLFGADKYIYVAYQVTLIDGNTFQTIDFATGGTPGKGLFGGTDIPKREASPGWPAADGGYGFLAKQQREEFQRLTYDMFDSTLPDTFHRLGMR